MILLLWLACGEKEDSAEYEIQENLPDTVTVDDYRPDVAFSESKDCASCHPTHYDDWSQSMHAYAAHSPVFDAMAQKAFRDTSGEVGNFCTSCHSPIGAIYGESGASTADTRSELSKNSISCEVCHSAVNHSQPVGDLSLEFSTTGEKHGPYGTSENEGHDSSYSDLIQSPEFCGSCHDVYNFPGIRIEEAYTEYSQSPAKEIGLSCQDCHMGSVPGQPSVKSVGPIAVVDGQTYPDRELSSHRFIGPDYSLLDTFPYADDVDASSIAQEEMFTQIQQLLQNAIHIADIRQSEEEINGQIHTVVEVDIESLTAGHNVPTGFTSERQLWIDITILSSDEVTLESGKLDTNGDLFDDHSEIVQLNPLQKDLHLVNFQSKNIKRQGLPDFPILEEVIFPFDADYIQKNSIKPMEIRTVRYVIARRNYITVQASLKYRNLPPYLLRALQLEHLIPRLRVFTLDEKDYTSQ
jgi:nitrate/TMAO reductase-like tetraheme cytochrome c subunit